MTDKQRAVIEAAREIERRALLHGDHGGPIVGLKVWYEDGTENFFGPEMLENLAKSFAALDADKPEAEAVCGTCKGTQLVNPQRNWVGAIMHPCPDCTGKEPAR